jgi:hypothetical protein
MLITYSMKKLFYLFIVCMFFYFIKYPSRALLASQNGILLWFNQILPTLLPFSILSNVLLSAWGKNRPTERRFLRINMWEWFVILCGLCFGFPIGSKLAADIYAGGNTTKKRAQILAAFTNNMSPAFVGSYVCTSVLGRPDLIFLIYAVLYGPPLVIGCLRLCLDSGRHPHSQTGEAGAEHAYSGMADHPGQGRLASQKNTASRFQIDMQIIDAGIMNSFLTLMKLCGYIVIFSITADMILHIRFLPGLSGTILVGLTEVTNGIAQLSHLTYPEPVKILLAVLFLSLGGLSGIAQTGAMLSPCGLPMKNYIRSKLLYMSCSVICLCILFFSGCLL